MKIRSALSCLLILGASLAFSLPLSATEGDPARGAKLYDSRCGACHSIDRNRVGPRHFALLGREAGTQPGYRYSKALKDSKLVWDESNLERWLADPQKVIRGQKMGFRVRKAEDRSDIVAFLSFLGTAAEAATER